MSGVSRRGFLKFLVAGAMVAGAKSLDPFGLFSSSEAYAAQRGPDRKGMAYDIQFGAFKEKEGAFRQKKSLESRLSSISDNLPGSLTVREDEGLYKVLWDTNATAETAQHIVDIVKKKGINGGVFRSLRDYWYFSDTQSNLHSQKYISVVCEKNPEITLRKYTCMYGSKALKEASAILTANNGRFKDGEIMNIPANWMRPAFLMGMREGIDYQTVSLKKSIWDIAARYTQIRSNGSDSGESIGNIEANVDILLKFNGMSRKQMNDLHVGTPIMIPSEIYKEIYSPVLIEEGAQKGTFLPVAKPKPKKERGVSGKQQRLIEKIKKGITGNYLKRGLREKGLGVLSGANMPAVLFESFNIQSKSQLDYYSNDENLKALARSYVQGILDYKRNHAHELTTVIIDNGHGTHDPGAVDMKYGTGKTETFFNKKIQKYMADYLEKEGIEAVKINYDGKPSVRKRIRYYNRITRKIGKKKGHKNVNGKMTCLYVSTHINSVASGNPMPPQVYVYSGRNKISKAIKQHSLSAAESILKRAVPFYDKMFSAYTQQKNAA